MQCSGYASLDWSSYWSWREQAWHAQHDVWAFGIKSVLMSLNVFIRIKQQLWSVAAIAGTTLVAIALSWPLVLSNWSVYRQWRRTILVLHYVLISVLVVRSLPHLLHAGSHISGGPAAVLLLLFKTGNLCMPLCASLHRLPWQLTALLSSGFMAAVIATRSGPVCAHFVQEQGQGNLRLINRLAAALDLLTGQGSSNSSSGAWTPFALQLQAACIGSSNATGNTTDGDAAAAWHSISSSSNSSSLAASAPGWSVPTCFNSTVAGWLVDEQQQQPAALLSAAAAAAAANPAATNVCARLLHGQCVATVTTLNVFAGIVLIVFAVLLSERCSKWEYVQRVNGAMLHSPQLPAAFREKSRWRFVVSQLVQLHVLLDVPLMLLWVAASSLFRAPAF